MRNGEKHLIQPLRAIFLLLYKAYNPYLINNESFSY